jgi:hypothetical protein
MPNSRQDAGNLCRLSGKMDRLGPKTNTPSRRTKRSDGVVFHGAKVLLVNYFFFAALAGAALEAVAFAGVAFATGALEGAAFGAGAFAGAEVICDFPGFAAFGALTLLAAAGAAFLAAGTFFDMTLP